MVVYLEYFTQPLKARQYFKFPYMGFYGQNEGFQVVSGCVCGVGRRIFCSTTKTHHDTEGKIWSDFCKELTTLSGHNFSGTLFSHLQNKGVVIMRVEKKF